MRFTVAHPQVRLRSVTCQEILLVKHQWGPPGPDFRMNCLNLPSLAALRMLNRYPTISHGSRQFGTQVTKKTLETFLGNTAKS